MRRALIRALGGALLFGAGVLTGAGLASQSAPRALHAAVEASLSEALGGAVSIEGARLLVSRPRVFGIPDVTVEATGLEAFGRGESAAFSAARLEAPLDPTSLLSGRLRFSSLSLEGVRLTLERGPDGHWEPPLLTPGFESPGVVLARVFRSALPAPVIEIRAGALTLIDGGEPAAGAPRRFDFDPITVKLLAPGLLQTGRLVVSGSLRETKGAAIPFEIESVAADAALPGFELSVSGLPLERITPYLRNLDPGLDLAGLATGILGVTETPTGDTTLALDLRVAGLRAGLGGETSVAAPEVAVDASLGITAASLSLSPGSTLRSGALSLAVEGSAARPLADDAPVAFSIGLPVLDQAGLDEIRAWLPARAREALDRAGRSIREGRLLDLTLAGETTASALEASLRGGAGLLPPGVALEARVEGIVVEPDGDEAVRADRGLARLEGPDTLVLTGLEGRLGDRSLPVLDLRMTGVGHLLAAPSEPVGPVVPTPGMRALVELLAPADDADTPVAWTSLDIDADWVLHPVFFRPLHGVRARLEPTAHGLRLDVAEATWGGLPIRGHGVLSSGEPGHVELAIAVGDVLAVRPAASPEAVARGSFVFQRPPKPGIYAHTLRAGFDLTGSRLTLFDASGSMDVPGRLAGDARLELGREGEVGATLRVSLAEADLADVFAALSDDPADSSGSLDVSARLDGPLRPGTSALHTLAGDVRITARRGALGIELPVLLAIAKASTTFNPFGSATGIRFDEIDAELALRDGQLSTRRSITVESPDLRLVVSGQLDLRQTPSRLEAVVGCFFFQPLDQMIGLIPVVSRIVLGPDRSLFGTYFELTGSWQSPKAGLIPMKTLALGPASFLLEDVPAFVQRGVAAVSEALAGPRPPSVAAPADPDPVDNGS